jgi:hypothetical protein
MNYNEHLEGNCFVYIQGNEVDIEKYYDVVRLSKDDKLILYPERGKTFVDTVCYRPYVKSVVTENPWIISCYSRENVWIIREGKWKHPDRQTYGASVEYITDDILGMSSSLPLIVLSGLDGIKEFKEKIKLNNLGE